MQIPLSSVDLSSLERQYATDALDSGWISASGQYVERAEKAFASFCSMPHCTLVCNGTAALHLALMCLGVKPGDEVIVPGMTFVSPAAAVARIGAVPVIADVEEPSWCIAPREVERLASLKTRGVIAVDVLGHPADFDALRAVCSTRGLFLIEDAAEAHGSRYKGRPTGSLGDVSTFSFFANKTLTCGEGGALLSTAAEVATRATLLKNHAMTKERPYWHEFVGDNFRLTNVQAAILLGQVERADEIIARRNELASLYRQGLADIDGVEPRPVAEWAEVVPWLVPVRILPAAGVSRDAMVKHLRAAGIDARPLWTPLAKLPAFSPYASVADIATPVAEQLLAQLLWLPTSSAMTAIQAATVIDVFRASLQC